MPRERNTAPQLNGPRDRKGDAPASDAAPRTDRRAASGCLWDACEALLSSRFEAAALDGVNLVALNFPKFTDGRAYSQAVTQIGRAHV